MLLESGIGREPPHPPQKKRGAPRGTPPSYFTRGRFRPVRWWACRRPPAGPSSAPCPSRCAAARPTMATYCGALNDDEPRLRVIVDLFRPMMVWPAFGTMTAFTTSPHSTSGTPITAASSIGGVRFEDVLDLARRDVLAAADDEVLLAAGDEQVPAFVQLPDVAGVQPAIDDGGAGRVFLLEVALHHARPSGRRFRPPSRAAAGCCARP